MRPVAPMADCRIGARPFSRSTNRVRRGFGLVVAALAVVPTLAATPANPAEAATAADDDGQETVEALTAELDAASGGVLTVAIDPETELVSLLGSTAGTALTDASDAAPEDVATDFVDDYGAMFGDDSELLVDRVAEGLDGTTAVRFRQHIDGVPVLAGEVAVQLDPDGRVLSASGESVAELDADVDTTPTVTADEASATAIAMTAKDEGIDSAALTASDPQLVIYDPQLIGAADVSSIELVWHVDVATALHDVERMVLIDAADGTVTLEFSTREDAGITVCDNANNDTLDEGCVPARVARTEATSAPTGNVDVDRAYEHTRSTLAFYSEVLGRDSVDDLGMRIVSTVNYCPAERNCVTSPYRNAFWNGLQMVFGTGYAAADDVVAHELSHGLTQYTSGLFYYAESGAINESMSDVFGELIDQSDSTGGVDPDADKWLLGEQLPNGALRSMKTPSAPPANRSAAPDRMRSTFFSGSRSDAHGVHINSGVGNKAAFLITDGGTFNGQTVVGLGSFKAAQIYYRVQTSFLGPGSDYLDLYGALQQACISLIGGPAGITAVDCQQVTKAVTATEMHLAPVTAGARLTAPVCNAGAIAGETLFSDDMESGLGKWVTSASHPEARWGSYTGSSQSGTHSLHGPDVAVGPSSAPNRSTTSSLRMAAGLSIPIGTSYLRFDHSFNLEGNAGNTRFYDGGVVEYSIDGNNGPWVDAGSTLGIVNGYTGTLPVNNTLGSRPAFSGTSPGYQTTRIDLSSLAGRTNVMFRFRIGTDETVGADGWFVDDVSVHRCGQPAPPTEPRSASVSFADGTATVRWLAPASTGFPALTGYVVTPYVDGVAQTAIETNSTATTLTTTVTTTPPMREGARHTFTVAARNAVGVGPAALATGRFLTAIGPARLFDTRPGESPSALRAVAKAKVGGATVLEMNVAGLAGLTPAAGIAAVSLNVTATGASVPGFVTVFPCGTRPPVSNVNFAAGDTVPNAVIAPVSASGSICFFANTPVDLVVDINGWFSIAPGYTAAGPARVLDTRAGESPTALRAVPKTRVGGTSLLQVQESDLPGLTPTSDVSAVSLNVTATGAGVPGFVTVSPCGIRPSSSSLNFGAGETVANATIAPVSGGGDICIFSNTPVDVVVDINGWFSDDPGFTPSGPARVLDTRPGQSPDAVRAVSKVPVGDGNVLQVKVADLADLTPTDGVGAVSLNVTATGAAVPGFVTVYPCTTLGQVSNLNFGAGDTIANAVIAPVSASGMICIFANTPTDVIVDINGWFVA